MLRAKYSEELAKSVDGHSTKPFKLTMDMQKKKIKENYYKILNRELSKTTATKQLKVLNLNADDIKLKIESAIVKHVHNNNALDMHIISGFYPLIRFGDLCGIEYPDFATHKSKKLSCEKNNK